MPILVFTILTPTLAFYVYALAQFWAEFRRRRHGEMKVVELHNMRLAPADFEPFPEAPSGGETELAARDSSAIRPFLIPAASERNADGLGPRVLAMYPKSRFIACTSPAVARPVNRSAKG